MGYRGVIKANKTYEKILAFEPKAIKAIDSAAMDKMIAAQQLNSDFEIADVVRNFTGLKEIEHQAVEASIERRALEQLKEVEEQAYKEAYDLGREEGRKEAFNTHSDQINQKLVELSVLTHHISEMKAHFLNSNENHLIKLVYHLAERIAFQEIDEKYNEIIVNVLSESVRLAHSEEKVKVHISEKQIEFLESLRKDNSRDLEFLKQVEFVADPAIEIGGCIISTNYGEVDARVSQRVEQLWLVLRDTIPPVKEKVEQVD
jgi:flagellar assembly protein FliH